MSTCPRCNQPHGLPELRVWCAGGAWPAQCRNCAAKFHPARAASAILAEVVLLPFSLLAAAAAPLWVAALYVLGFAAAYLAVRAAVPLVEADAR